MSDKVIVTHRGALVAKYGVKGLARIRAAVNALIAADKERGLETTVVYLDNGPAMRKLGGRPLVDVDDYCGAKGAIDAVFKAFSPHYLMILGSSDVVPHQDLKNPVYGPNRGEDDDKEAWGDLPYACDAPYGRDPAMFVGPTRVVGRLPDLTGASNPSHLLALLKTASTWRSRKATDFSDYFALSTFTWRKSTHLSVGNVFGKADRMLIAPPTRPSTARKKLGARMHFINCHGGLNSPILQGQKGRQYPVSLTSEATKGAIRNGTVAAAECCYGAQLYNSVKTKLPIPICQSYLRQKAWGFFGSTTIAFGTSTGNGSADLICQYFLLQVLDGASLGRAALTARQQFVEQTGQMDPFDLKTLAQFCLLGDPSIQPVLTPDTGHDSNEAKPAKATARFRRNERRAGLKKKGEFLEETKLTASKRQRGAKPSRATRATLANLAEEGGLSAGQKFRAYKVSGPRRAKAATAKLASAPSRYYLAVGRPNRFRVAVIAKEVGGRIIDWRIYHER